MLLNAVVALGLGGCGLQLGRAPVRTGAISLGPVQVAAPEPRLQEDLARAVAREAAARVPVGAGPALSARVLSAEAAPVAAGGGLWEARLVVHFSLATSPPVELQVSGQRLFGGDGDHHAATGQQRSAAFQALAAQLAAEAVPVLLAADPLPDAP